MEYILKIMDGATAKDRETFCREQLDRFRDQFSKTLQADIFNNAMVFFKGTLDNVDEAYPLGFDYREKCPWTHIEYQEVSASYPFGQIGKVERNSLPDEHLMKINMDFYPKATPKEGKRLEAIATENSARCRLCFIDTIRGTANVSFVTDIADLDESQVKTIEAIRMRANMRPGLER